MPRPSRPEQCRPIKQAGNRQNTCHAHNVAGPAVCAIHAFNRVFSHTAPERTDCAAGRSIDPAGDDVSAKLVRNCGRSSTAAGRQWLSEFGSFLDTQPPIGFPSDFRRKEYPNIPHHLTKLYPVKRWILHCVPPSLPQHRYSQNFFLRPRTVAVHLQGLIVWLGGAER